MNENFEDLRDEVDRLVQLKGKDNWAGTRSESNFEIVERTYSFGTRTCYKRKNNDDPVYVDLQQSRGLAIYENDTLENVMSQLDETMTLNSADIVRIEELEKHYRMHLILNGLIKTFFLMLIQEQIVSLKTQN